MVENRKKHRQNSHLIIPFPTSGWASGPVLQSVFLAVFDHSAFMKCAYGEFKERERYSRIAPIVTPILHSNFTQPPQWRTCQWGTPLGQNCDETIFFAFWKKKIEKKKKRDVCLLRASQIPRWGSHHSHLSLSFTYLPVCLSLSSNHLSVYLQLSFKYGSFPSLSITALVSLSF